MEKEEWWKRSVVYQIYPRSFCDSNGDGIGDINGIRSKLWYLQELGVDVIWLSPVYASPNADHGYDISDYYEISPEYGTMEDMKALILECENCGIKIMMDLVVNHTSDEHLWFKEAKKSKDNPYRDYYIWRKGEAGNAPNKLESCFGGSAWEYSKETGEYYLHFYHKKQPDLNWENEAMRKEIWEMMNFWIDMGIGGFRMDVIDVIGKIPDQEIKENGPKLHEYLQEMNRETFGNKNLMTVGECWGADLENGSLYSDPKRKELDMVFQFEQMLLDQVPGGQKWDLKPLALTQLKQAFAKWQKALDGKGWNSLFWNSHDLPRIVSRWGNDKEYRVESAKMLATVLHGMKGTPYIYQGEEIGMTNYPFSGIEDLIDVESVNMYRERKQMGYQEEEIMKSLRAKARDNARTSMQWNERYQASAEELLKLVGGKENIISAAHCATRLRLVLKDESKADVDGILKVELVKGQFANGGQFQIIIGSGTVNEVYKRFIEAGGIAEATKSEVKQAAVQKMNPLQRLVKTLSDVFVPLIPALVASGLMMGLNNVLTANGLFVSGKSLVEAYPALSDIASMINTFASAAYAFLPILIGFSATKMFGGNPYLGAVIGMIMVSGDLLNAYAYGTAVTEGTIPVWNIFGLTIEKVGYQGTVLPVLAASYILSFVEKKLHKYIPEILDNLLTPLLTVMITGFVTFTVVGGIMRTAGDMLTNSFVWMHDTLGIVGGMILGFLYSPLTMTGMHHSLLPVDIQMVAAGGSFLLAIASCNNVAQGGATLCAMLRTKDKKLKSVAATSGVSAMLGITEPAMFGVNLKLKYPFYGAMIGAALGGGYVTLTNVLNTAPGTAGIVGFVCVPAPSMLNFLIGAAISIASGFIFTYIMSNMKKFNKELEKQEEKIVEEKIVEEKIVEEKKAGSNIICSPLTGTAIPMSEVPDDTFAAEVLGKGMAVIPSEGKVVAPCEGEVSTLFDTKHAIGISAKNGAELLIHVGVNTVDLKGNYYKAHVAQGDRVKPGQVLLTFDIQKIKEAGYPVATPVIVANTEDYKTVEGLKTGEVHCMEPLIKLEEA